MVKSIELPKPTRLTIIKDGNLVADIYVPGIEGYIDTDKINASVSSNDISGDTISLEV